MRGGQDGFSLIEVMVALAVFSLAVIAHLHLQSENARTIARLEERALALIIAENRLVERLAQSEPLRTGTQEGREDLGGVTWTWRERVAGTAQRGMVQIVVSVRREESEQILADVTGFREAER